MTSFDNKAWAATGVEIITEIQLATENYWAKGKLPMTVNPGTTGYSSFSKRELLDENKVDHDSKPSEDGKSK